MKITIPAICFRERPVLWELDEATGHAECLNRMHQSDRVPDLEALRATLQSIPHVTVSMDRIYIEDIKHFVYVPQIDKSVRFARSRSNSSPPSSPCSDSSSERASASTAAKKAPTPFSLSLPEHTGSPRKAPISLFRPIADLSRPLLSPRAHRSLAIDDFVPTMDPTVIGDTFKYKGYFSEKVRVDKKSRPPASLIQSESALAVKLQYEISSLINAIKDQMCTELTHLFDKLLNPAFRRCLQENEKITTPMRKYLEQAILSVMKPAPLEPVSEDRILDVYALTTRSDTGYFPGDFITAHVKEAHQLLIIRARMWRFYFFISDALAQPTAGGTHASSSSATDDRKGPTADEETNAIFDRFKKQLQSQKYPIEASLSCLARLSLQLIHTIEKCHQMEAKLKRRIEQHTPAIEGMLSFHCMMNNILQSSEGKSSKASLKDIQLKELVKDITTKAINLISEKYYHAPVRLGQEPTVQHLIDILREGQIDFYISPGLFNFWDSTLRAELAAHYQLESLSLRAMVRSKADRNLFIAFIGEKLITNLDHYLSAQCQLQERPVCSSSSSYRSSSTDSLADSSSSMSSSFTPR